MFGFWQGVFNARSAKNANKELDKLWEQDPTYTKNPLAGEQFGLAKNLFYGPMFGRQQEARNIFGGNANFNAQVGRNSTDASQSLALAAAGQGQADQAFSNLQLKEQQNKYGMPMPT
jgi:predicted DsbA family dithiol-disulfide isomerase